MYGAAVVSEARMPYVEFHQATVEDRTATELAGHRVVKNIAMIHVMQIGSKDCVPMVAEDWLERKRKESFKGTYPEAWVQHFQSKYERWLQGLETPPEGTSITELTFLSPADVENLRAAHVLTGEDLAQLSEQGMALVGMGARELRDRARRWFESANDVGKVAAKLENLSVENADLRRRLEEIMKVNETLRSRLDGQPGEYEQAPPRRGRPPKNRGDLSAEA